MKLTGKIILLILTFLSPLLSLFGQDSATFQVVAKFHPLAVINPDRPSIVGSIEVLIRNRVGIEFGYGKRYTDNFWLSDTKVDRLTVSPNGETKFLEINYYKPLYAANEFKTALYFGIGYTQFYDYRNKMKYYSHQGDSMFHKDSFGVFRKVDIFVFKVGQLISYKSLVLNFYGELGVRYKRQRFIGSEIDPDNDSFIQGIWILEKPGNGYFPTINFGFKVGYRIFGSH